MSLEYLPFVVFFMSFISVLIWAYRERPEENNWLKLQFFAVLLGTLSLIGVSAQLLQQQGNLKVQIIKSSSEVGTRIALENLVSIVETTLNAPNQDSEYSFAAQKFQEWATKLKPYVDNNFESPSSLRELPSAVSSHSYISSRAKEVLRSLDWQAKDRKELSDAEEKSRGGIFGILNFFWLILALPFSLSVGLGKATFNLFKRPT